jgi:uncharacterized protein YjiS (DUF1127 family)
MAEMIGLSGTVGRRTGRIGGFIAALKGHLSRLRGGGRATRLPLDRWPDYLLRDIGLDRSVRDQDGARTTPADWLLR